MRRVACGRCRLTVMLCLVLGALALGSSAAAAASRPGPPSGAAESNSAPAAAWARLSPAARAAEVQAAASQLHPTSCTPNFSAANCPTEEAAAFRTRIASLLASGLTPQQVVARFISAYGPQVRFLPPTRGLDALIWALPFIVVVLGALICWRFVRLSAARRPGVGAPAGTGPAPPLTAAGAAPREARPGVEPAGTDHPGMDPALRDYL